MVGFFFFKVSFLGKIKRQQPIVGSLNMLFWKFSCSWSNLRTSAFKSLWSGFCYLRCHSVHPGPCQVSPWVYTEGGETLFPVVGKKVFVSLFVKLCSQIFSLISFPIMREQASKSSYGTISLGSSKMSTSRKKKNGSWGWGPCFRLKETVEM